MARYSPVQNAFVAGELTPHLEGRDDIDQYHQGMRQAVNGIVLPYGGFQRRSGTRFVQAVKDETLFVRLLDYQVSTDQAYVIETGTSYCRFFVNEGSLSGEVATSFTTAMLPDLHKTQANDVMWIVHPDIFPVKLSRTSATTFSISKVVFTDGKAPMRPDNLDLSNNLSVTGTASAAVLTWSSSTTGLSSGRDTGRHVRYKSGDDGRWFQITAVLGVSSASATMLSTSPTIETGVSTTNWALGMFSDTEGARTVQLHEGRLGYFGSKTNQNWEALSKASDFDNFSPGGTSQTDEDAILRPVTSGRSDAIQWAESADDTLVIGTTAAEFSMTGDTTGLLTPSANSTKKSTGRGSAHIQTLNIDNEVAFIQRNQRKLRIFSFDQLRITRLSRDVSLFAEHILQPGGVELHYQQDPNSIIWVPRDDGVLAGFTYEREQKVNGAHRQIMGGSYLDGSAVVESMAVIPAPAGTHDQIWLSVLRTINGATHRYIEFMMAPFRSNLTVSATAEQRSVALEPTPFSDCSLTMDDPISISSISIAAQAVFNTGTAHGLSNTNSVRLRGIVSRPSTSSASTMETLNNISYLVSDSTSNTFKLKDADGNYISTTGMQPYLGMGSVYLEGQLITGLTHLIGETVDVQADGAALEPLVVSASGTVSLTTPASIVHVGLNYVTIGETLKFVGGGRIGTDAGRRQRIQRIIARVLDTIGVEWRQGPTGPNLEASLVHFDGDPMDRTPPLFTGDIDIALGGSWNADATVYFEQSRPLPMTILSLMPSADSREG